MGVTYVAGMPAPFPPISSGKHFPILRACLDHPYHHIMGCDGVGFFAMSSPGMANSFARKPGQDWHLYGDVRWPAQSAWVEFPLGGMGMEGSAGVLVMLAEIPGDEMEPFEWAANNHPLLRIIPTMRAEEEIERMADMLLDQELDPEEIPGPEDEDPRYVQGYCLYISGFEDEGLGFLGSYTDILNEDGIPIPRYRMGNFKGDSPSLCQFILHALFRLNEGRLAGAEFLEYWQNQTFAPVLLDPEALPPRWVKFHPSRTLRTRPAVRALAPPLLSRGMMAFEDLERVGEARRRETNAEKLAFEIECRPRETSLATMNVDMNSSLAAFMHRAHGGAIYLLPDRLVEEFDHTDCKEVQVPDITLPFQSVFLKFTPPQALLLGDNAEVDGCYLTNQAEEVLLTLTSRLKGVDYEKSLSVTCVDPIFALHLPTTDPEMTVERAVELGIEAFLADNAPPTEDQSTNIQHADGTVTYYQDVRAASRKKRIEQFRSQEPAFRACLNIVINAACFISFRPEDVTDEWDGEPPAEVVAAAEIPETSRSSRDRKTGALHKIANGDFTRIKVCGRSLFGDEPHPSGDGQGKSPKAHWRRGHWRRQRHGTGLALIVLRWIRPTIVKKDNGILSEARLYEV